jgi:hypothetical protein
MGGVPGLTGKGVVASAPAIPKEMPTPKVPANPPDDLLAPYSYPNVGKFSAAPYDAKGKTRPDPELRAKKNTIEFPAPPRIEMKKRI